MNWKIQYFVNYDPRFNLRFAFVEMFDKLKDAEAFVETLEGKYWQIVRQEYSGFSYGEEKVIKKGYNPRKE